MLILLFSLNFFDICYNIVSIKHQINDTLHITIALIIRHFAQPTLQIIVNLNKNAFHPDALQQQTSIRHTNTQLKPHQNVPCDFYKFRIIRHN